MTKQKLIIIIVAIVLAIAIPVTLVLVLGGNSKNKATPAEQYIALEGKALHDFVNSLADNPSFSSANTAVSTTLDIIPSDTLLAMANMQNIDFAEKITLNMDFQQVDGLFSSLIGVGLDGNIIVHADMITDPATGIYYMAIPTVSNHYLKIDNNMAGVATPAVGNVSDLLASLDMPAIKASLNKYIDAAMAEMTYVEKTTETVKVADKSKEATVLTNSITEKIAVNMVKAVLNEVKKDNTVKALLPEGVDLAEVVDEAIASLPQDPSDDKNDAIVLKVYLDGDQVIGREIGAGDSFAFRYMTIDTSTEISASVESNGFTLLGNSKDNGGSFTLSIQQVGATLEIGTLSYTGNAQKGSCELTLSDAAENLIFGASTTPMNPALKINWEGSDTDANIEILLEMVGETLVTLDISTTIGTPSDITLPSDALDITSPDALQTYLNSIDLSTLRQNMLNANIPGELVDLLINALQNELG